MRTTDLLLACQDKDQVNDTDRKDIEQHKASLERSHVDYLLRVDTELVELMKNPQAVPVFFAKCEYNFGSIAMDRNPAYHLDQKIKAFEAHEGKAIFVLFFGVVNHWISVIVHKPD